MSTFIKKVSSAVLASAVVLTAVGSTAGVNAAYTNVEAANVLSSQGIIVDYSANPAGYELGNTLLRREGVKVMEKLSGRTIPTSCTSSSFSDVATSDWVCKYTEDALAAGFIAANPTFRPDDTLTKIEGLKEVMQARGIAKSANADWKMAYVEGAVAAGIATSFSDYNTPVDRGTFFVWAAEALVPSENDDDLLGALLGDITGEEETPATETPATETPATETPVVSGDDVLAVSLNPETPSNGLASVNTARVPLLVFDVKAGSQDVTLNQATFEFIGLGAYANLDNVAVYNTMGERVSKTKNFSEITREISFDKNIVVEAGTTMTLTVAGQITDPTTPYGDDNATYGIKLIDLQASSSVEGEDLVGALLVGAQFANTAKIRVTDKKASGTVTIGENMKLAGFQVEERNDNEDIIIKTITLHVQGSVNTDDISDLTLNADGQEIATDLMVNADDEIVAAVNYELAADDKVKFELYGTITGSVGDTIDIAFEFNDDIYAVGKTSGMPVSLENTSLTTENIAQFGNPIEGAEINIAFDKSGIDEAKADASDVLIGTLNMTATSDDYEVRSIKVTVTNAADAAVVIDDLKLGGSSYDTLNVATGEYEFTDITLPKGVKKALDLTMRVNKETNPITVDGKSLTFNVRIVRIDDDTNNVTYLDTNPSATNVSAVLSTTALDTKVIDIKSASFTITNTQVNDRDLVLGNGIETVIYKGKISVGDSDDVTINDFNLVQNAPAYTITEDLDKVIANATLNIGGQTFDADIDADSVDFSSINAVIAAGSDNVEVLVTAVLKSNNSVIAPANILALKLDTTDTTADGISNGNLDLEDSDGNNLTTANVNVASANSNATQTTLKDKGALVVTLLNEPDTDDNLENTVLAGSSDVTIAELNIEAQEEDVKVKELVFTIPGVDHSNTLASVKLVNIEDNSVIADGAVITFDGTDTLVSFKNDFVVSESDNVIDAELVADLNSITGEGDATSASIGTITVNKVAATSISDIKGVASNDDLLDVNNNGIIDGGESLVFNATTTEALSIVPTKLTFAVIDNLSNGTAKIEIIADSGNNTVGTNSQTPEVELVSVVATDVSNAANTYKVYKEGNAAGVVATAATANTVLANLSVNDLQFSTSARYVYLPAVTTVGNTYTMILSGNVATYKIRDAAGNYLQPNGTFGATGTAQVFTTTLESDISVGSKTY